jgi:serine/threonine protein kinase
MSLNAGTRLGAYEIVALVGAGGMGEVYRARDARLARDVAMKVLPAGVADDPERLQRFEQEARAAAALNHPGIPAVYDIGQYEAVPYIVSELLEGETLRERLHGGALPVRKAVEYAVQIAHALASAHEKGIVHRDLKPENIFVTSDGRLKILDFGLAKLMQPERAIVGASLLPTTPPPTLPGVVLGTIGYMSPEQVRGLDADHRADIFAFGAILYEMLSGRRAFGGNTAIDAMTAILEEDPAGLPTAERHIPSALARIVDRCLEKSPAARFKSADDLAFALEALSSPSGEREPVVDHTTPRRGERLAWSVAAVFATVLAGTLAVPYIRTPVAAPEMRLEVTTPATSDPLSFAISPDGRQLVFAASGDGPPRLWLRPLDTATARPLAGTEGATFPFWSPDSRSVGFFDGSTLKRIDIGGDVPQTLTNAAPRGGSWNTDGIILFARSAVGPLFRVAASGGEPAAATKLDTPLRSHRFPQFLPDGRQFLFFAQGTAESQGIYLGALDDSETKRLTAADAAGVFVSPDWLLFVRQGTLVARHIDLARGELIGDPVTVAGPVSVDGVSQAAALSVSAEGVVTYRAGGANRRQLAWFDRSGRAIGTLGAPDENGLSYPRLSPDGRRVAVFRAVQTNNDIWLLDSVRSTRLTFDPSLDRFPIWSSDGSRIVFVDTKGPA